MRCFGIDPVETILNKLPAAIGMPRLFEAEGFCEAATDKVAGLSVPQWSSVWLVIPTLVTAWLLFRRRQFPLACAGIS